MANPIVSRLTCASLVVVLAACGGQPAAPASAHDPVRAAGAPATGFPTAAAAPPPPMAALAPGQRPTTTAPPTAPLTAAAPTPPPVPLTGAESYVKYCALCHGPKAEGYAADNAPSLVSATFAATVTDDFLRLAIERGRPGTAMAGYSNLVGGPLNPGDIDKLMAEIRRMGPPQRLNLGARAVHGSSKRGQAVYEKNCQLCHGTKVQRGNAVHLYNPLLLASASDGFLRFAVENGRAGTKMEGWKGKLPPHAIDDVVAYLRSQSPKDVPAALAAAAAVATGQEPALPLKGPLIINPKGKQATLTLKDDRLVSIEQVKAAFDQKRRIILVDARSPSDWLRMHITGAISVPYYDMKGLDKLPNDGTWIVAYCACPHHASGVVFDELRRRGYKTSAVLDEGVFAWQTKGYPVVAAPGVLPVPAPPPLPATATGMGNVPGTAMVPGTAAMAGGIPGTAAFVPNSAGVVPNSAHGGVPLPHPVNAPPTATGTAAGMTGAKAK